MNLQSMSNTVEKYFLFEIISISITSIQKNVKQ